jgi:hypothetical protein
MTQFVQKDLVPVEALGSDANVDGVSGVPTDVALADVLGIVEQNTHLRELESGSLKGLNPPPTLGIDDDFDHLFGGRRGDHRLFVRVLWSSSRLDCQRGQECGCCLGESASGVHTPTMRGTGRELSTGWIQNGCKMAADEMGRRVVVQVPGVNG